MIALVLAIAGMMFLTTPCVNAQVTPSILNSEARAEAFWYSHSMWSGSSVSSFLSDSKDSGQSEPERSQSPSTPLNTFGHSRTLAHSMQCSGNRGVFAIVQIGNAVGGVSMSICRTASSSARVQHMFSVHVRMYDILSTHSTR